MSLRDLVRDATVARLSPAEKLAQLRTVRLYFRRPETPGFLVAETSEGPVVPVFTSWERLALFAGACGWASTTAEDLVGLLPEGVRALVDPLGEQPFLLDGTTLAGPAGTTGPAEAADPAETEGR
ncbi:SseB family protein [Streptomyces tubbatahanensis]|uniref:SseB family protein n=1 Tax=Streptomyces tubbatahanensis TaxID=2923272 RepID=A0ABY3XWH3_9ACTN|nr:SseB family protein [Streptomyces tubbatahanensis]UNS98618.1 SseB family protein [Streptomyces tubbatahanensis]